MFPKIVLFVLSLVNVKNENFHEQKECKVVFEVSSIILQTTYFLKIGKVMSPPESVQSIIRKWNLRNLNYLNSALMTQSIKNKKEVQLCAK